MSDGKAHWNMEIHCIILTTILPLTKQDWVCSLYV